jgi:sialate O-acetylesterase
MAGKLVAASVILLWLSAALPGADLRVTGGVLARQVVQRGERNAADIAIRGEGGGTGPLQARVTRLGGVLPGFDWWRLADIRNSTWSGTITDVPAGGPYRIELRSGSQDTSVNDVLVGDLWVLAGQSNMQGDGLLASAVRGSDQIHSFDMSDQWVIAEEPLHTLAAAADPVHWPRGVKPTDAELRRIQAIRSRGAGLGLPFALEMVKRMRVPVGLIPCAHGGTAIEEWSPAGRGRGGESLYGSMYRRVQAVGGKVAGVLWYQGEADGKPALAPLYRARFEELIAAVRKDFGQPSLPFYYVQLGRHVNDANVAEWNLVQETQRRVETSIPHVGMAVSIDLEMDDGIHIGTDGLVVLGRRLALLASKSTNHGPRPLKATAGDGFVRLKLEGVTGRIEEGGRLSGFTVADARGHITPRIFRVRIDAQDPTSLLLYFDGGKIPPKFLWYGHGKNPYCNIRDSAGMALPVFGPFPIDAEDVR